MLIKQEIHQNNVQTSQIDGFQWPARKSCAVAIGWHVDSETGPISSDPRNTQHINALSEGAYGVSTALPRILELHEKLNVPGTFFVPGYVAVLHPEAIRAIVQDGHEVAHHGYLHEQVFSLNEAEERKVFQRGYDTLREITGKEVVGWSAPLWGVRQSTLEILCEMGMLYDCSLMEYDTPYLISTSAGSLVELPISPVLDDWPLFGMSISPDGGNGVNATAESAYQIWKEEFDGMRRFGCFFTTTFHPNLTGRPGRLDMMYRLLTYMKSRDDVWWATCQEVAKYVHSLIE
jgi:peptidoglycan/xylan/chitin deacetylase (PgdA/CDA1 family)